VYPPGWIAAPRPTETAHKTLSPTLTPLVTLLFFLFHQLPLFSPRPSAAPVRSVLARCQGLFSLFEFLPLLGTGSSFFLPLSQETEFTVFPAPAIQSTSPAHDKHNSGP